MVRSLGGKRNNFKESFDSDLPRHDFLIQIINQQKIEGEEKMRKFF